MRLLILLFIAPLCTAQTFIELQEPTHHSDGSLVGLITSKNVRITFGSGTPITVPNWTPDRIGPIPLDSTVCIQYQIVEVGYYWGWSNDVCVTPSEGE